MTSDWRRVQGLRSRFGPVASAARSAALLLVRLVASSRGLACDQPFGLRHESAGDYPISPYPTEVAAVSLRQFRSRDRDPLGQGATGIVDLPQMVLGHCQHHISLYITNSLPGHVSSAALKRRSHP